MSEPLSVGVYVDGFNLYYGARQICGRGTPGWRWLDIRALAQRLLSKRRDPRWADAQILRVVFCTARVSGRSDASSPADQDAYWRALRAVGAVDIVEVGNHVSSVITRPLARRGPHGRPILEDPARTVDVAHREEKASDVNVATHLLLDVLQAHVSGALVISNDSDLRLPLKEARLRIPVATINPTSRRLAGHLKGTDDDGIGGHWWYQLVADDLTSCQLPSTVRRVRRPQGW